MGQGESGNMISDPSGELAIYHSVPFPFEMSLCVIIPTVACTGVYTFVLMLLFSDYYLNCIAAARAK